MHACINSFRHTEVQSCFNPHWLYLNGAWRKTSYILFCVPENTVGAGYGITQGWGSGSPYPNWTQFVEGLYIIHVLVFKNRNSTEWQLPWCLYVYVCNSGALKWNEIQKTTFPRAPRLKYLIIKIYNKKIPTKDFSSWLAGFWMTSRPL